MNDAISACFCVPLASLPGRKLRLQCGLACLIALACLVPAGCNNNKPVANANACLAGDSGSAEFLDGMSSKTCVSENEAMHGVLLLMDGKDSCQSFQQRLDLMRERKLVDASWDFDASRPITLGKLAYMLCGATKARGGVILTLTGPSQRYCLREMQYQNIMSSGYVYSKVTGMEFVAILTRADSYIQSGEVPVTIQSGATTSQLE